jgi:uncharacterized protein
MMLKPHMPSIDDQEDGMVPAGLPAIIDAHVHIFPRSIFSAVWKWFDDYGWQIRYQMSSSEVLGYLLSRGVEHIIAFQYAHKPGIASMLNTYMAEKCREFSGRVTGLATVFPGEENAEQLLQEAFDSGLAGLKLHAHVQCFDMNSDDMNRLYECCRVNKKPVVMHIGREPNSPAYRCDPYQLCSARKCEQVLKNFPDLKICVPHLGIDETAAYKKMIEKYDNLWLDTTMALAGYLPIKGDIDLRRYRTDRIMYGSDFPNIPYAWDRELKILTTKNISSDTLEEILNNNATDFFSLSLKS